MTIDKTTIQLWKNAFNVSIWKNKEKIDGLLALIKSMDTIVKKYLKRTELDFPNLTDHSIEHANMLWVYTDIIVGNEKKYINPLEAFILNSAFLLHDAGMCYSIFNDKDSIRSDVFYSDYIAANEEFLEKKDLDIEALFYAVRQNHGEYAFKISTELINDEEFLIPDVDLRQEFGDIIGKIAKSHTCNVDYIEREFGQFYSSPKFPTDWSIDYKKLAIILRCVDAANIDNMRTPKTLKMISEIQGDSQDHWTFQKKLGFPRLESDGYISYATNNPFKKSEQKSWWYCYNALKVLDDELKSANNYFVNKGQKGFSAKGVKYIEDPLTLGANSIKTVGWDSINTTVRVSNPVHIAAELGGKKLYGSIAVCIRELIQNSIDAVHVHRLHTGQNNLAVGWIKISLDKIDNDYYLSITDNGIGMSQSLLTNELLDFGGSYWKSNKFYNDFKGLSTKGFESIGKFGIGFFSVFMLGANITVTSWKYGEDIKNMRTLDFYDGLSSNPILRQPTAVEKNNLIDRGTSVRIKLHVDPADDNGFLKMEKLKDMTLNSLVKFYAPSADVDIHIKEVDNREATIKANTLEKLTVAEFVDYTNLKNIYRYTSDKSKKFKEIQDSLPDFNEIVENDKIIGKLIILPERNRDMIDTPSAIMVSKGIRVNEISGVIGYISSNEVVSIKRDVAVKTVSYDSIKRWAQLQFEQIQKPKLSELYKKRILDFKLAFNWYDDSFPITRQKKDGIYSPVTISDFREYVRENDSVIFYEENDIEKMRLPTHDGFANIYYGLNIDGLLDKKVIEELNNSEKILYKILEEQWGKYEETRSNLDGYIFHNDKPIVYTWSYTRPKKPNRKLKVIR